MGKRLKLPVSIMFSVTGPHVLPLVRQDLFQNVTGEDREVENRVSAFTYTF